MHAISGRRVSSAGTLAALGACAVLLLGAAPAAAATFTVTNGSDSGAGSLRQAITVASTGPPDSLLCHRPSTRRQAKGN